MDGKEHGVSDDVLKITKDEILESINEWPVTQSTEEYYSTDINRISHPDSVARFFLRNVGRPKTSSASLDRERSCLKSSQPYEDELLVDVALAKWWKKEGRHLTDCSNLPESKNPDTFINFVSNTDTGREFVKNGIKRLRDKLAGGMRGSDVHSALSSFYEKAGSLSPAMMHLEAAIEKAPDKKELKWRLKRLSRMIRYRQEQEKVLRGMNFSSTSNLSLPKAMQVKRVSANSLSFQEFFEDYALKSRPVILQDLVPKMTSVPWSIQHIVEVAGDCKVVLKKHVTNSVQWAQLEDSETMTIKDYIQCIQDGSNTQGLYLFDWSILGNSPVLAKELVIPKYFAGDLLQRTSEGSLYRDSWPSLFIASRGLTSELHIDTFGSNFWMALFEGKKRWVFYDKSDVSKLYPLFRSPWSSDPCFQVDLSNPDLQQYPLVSMAQPMECILEEGEVLFVPAGCPHRVENLEQSLAISGNYVDLSNFDLVKEELATSGLLEERSEQLYKQLSDKDFPSNMDANLEHLPWVDFKGWTRQGYDKYSITYDIVKEKLSGEESVT